MSPARVTIDATMLTDLDRAILDLAAQPFPGRGRMDAAIHQLGLSTTRYYQRLDALIRSAEGIAYDPITCRRMREVADAS